MKQKIRTGLLLTGVCTLFFTFSYLWNAHFGGTSPANAAASSSSDDTSSENMEGNELPPDKQIAAPDFTLTDVQTGKTTTLSAETKNQPVVFSFWATWCGPCNMELPVLNDLSKKYNGRVSFYGINSNDDPATIRRFVAAKGFTMPMLGDTSQVAASAYSVQSIPRLVIVGTDGKIKYQMDGFDPNEATYLPGVLDQVLAENHSGFFGLFSRRT